MRSGAGALLLLGGRKGCKRATHAGERTGRRGRATPLPTAAHILTTLLCPVPCLLQTESWDDEEQQEEEEAVGTQAQPRVAKLHGPDGSPLPVGAPATGE